MTLDERIDLIMLHLKVDLMWEMMWAVPLLILLVYISVPMAIGIVMALEAIWNWVVRLFRGKSVGKDHPKLTGRNVRCTYRYNVWKDERN